MTICIQIHTKTRRYPQVKKSQEVLAWEAWYLNITAVEPGNNKYGGKVGDVSVKLRRGKIDQSQKLTATYQHVSLFNS